MKSTLKTALSVCLLSLPVSVAAKSASAEGWSIYDLEEVAGPRENCMKRARNTLSSYLFDNGGGETDSASWKTNVSSRPTRSNGSGKRAAIKRGTLSPS